MKTIAVMPIKLHNERCPGKNIKLLGGRPLLQYELNTLNETGLVDDIYVYCSSESVYEYLPNGIKLAIRPEYLDSPETNFTQIFSEFIKQHNADIYIYAHATAPFVSVDTMKECILAVQSGKHDSAFCAKKIKSFLWRNGEPLNFDAENIPRTQDLPDIYSETSGIYVFTKDVFLNLKRRVGNDPFIKDVSVREAVDIDEPIDFKIAELMLNLDV